MEVRDMQPGWSHTLQLLHCSAERRNKQSHFKQMRGSWEIPRGSIRGGGGTTTAAHSSLYRTIKWSDISLAYRYWHAWYKQDSKTMKVTSEEEAEFMDMLFTPMSMESFRMYNLLFSCSTLEYSPVLTIGEFLLHVIFTHSVFGTPGLGVYVQLSGWAMGTNAAPTWAILVKAVCHPQAPML